MVVRNSNGYCGIILRHLSPTGAQSDRLRTREAGFDRHLTKHIDSERCHSCCGIS
jgi:hypothetical protein